MYVREKRIQRGEKSYSYWQVVEGHRVEGKVRQRVVAHIGAAEDREDAEGLARLKGFLCGVAECGQAGTVKFEAGTWTDRRLPWEGDKKEYLLCSDHHDAWRSGERVVAYPLWPGFTWPRS